MQLHMYKLIISDKNPARPYFHHVGDRRCASPDFCVRKGLVSHPEKKKNMSTLKHSLDLQKGCQLNCNPKGWSRIDTLKGNHVRHPFEGAGGWWFLFGFVLNVHRYLTVGEMIQAA